MGVGTQVEFLQNDDVDYDWEGSVSLVAIWIW